MGSSTWCSACTGQKQGQGSAGAALESILPNAAGTGGRAVNKLQSPLGPCVGFCRGHRKWQGGNQPGGILQPPSCWIPWVGVMESLGAGRSRAGPGERTPPFLGRIWPRRGKGGALLVKSCSLEQGAQEGPRCSRAGPWWPLGSSHHHIRIAWRAFPSSPAPGSVPCVAEMRRHACFWSGPAQNQGSRQDQGGGGPSPSLWTPDPPAGNTTHRRGQFYGYVRVRQCGPQAV